MTDKPIESRHPTLLESVRKAQRIQAERDRAQVDAPDPERPPFAWGSVDAPEPEAE